MPPSTIASQPPVTDFTKPVDDFSVDQELRNKLLMGHLTNLLTQLAANKKSCNHSSRQAILLSFSSSQSIKQSQGFVLRLRRRRPVRWQTASVTNQRPGPFCPLGLGLSCQTPQWYLIPQTPECLSLRRPSYMMLHAPLRTFLKLGILIDILKMRQMDANVSD